MILKRFIQNKFPLYLLVISIFLSAFVYYESKSLNDEYWDNDIHMDAQKELEDRLSPRDLETFLFYESRGEYEYINKDKKEVQEIEDLMKLREIGSEIQNSLSFGGMEAEGDFEAIPPREMNKKRFLKKQEELVHFYTENRCNGLLDENYMDFVVKRLNFLNENDLNPVDERQNLLNRAISQKSSLLFNGTVLVILAFLLSFSLDTEEIFFYLKEDLILLKVKQFLFLILAIIFFIVSFLIFSGIFFTIFGDGIGSFNYYYYNPQEILGKTTYVFEKPGTILLYRGVLFTIFTAVFSVLFHVLFKLFHKGLFKILGVLGSLFLGIHLWKGSFETGFNVFKYLEKYSFLELTFKNILSLLFVVIGAFLLYLFTLYGSDKEIKKNRKSIVKPFTVFYYFQSDLRNLVTYLLLIALVFINYSYEKNIGQIDYFYETFSDNLISYEEEYKDEKNKLDNFHDIFNERRNLTDEIRENLPQSDQYVLNFLEKDEKKELKERIKIIKTNKDRYESFSKIEEDPKTYYQKEKITVENDPFYIFYDSLGQVPGKNLSYLLNIGFIEEYEKRNLPTPKTFLTPIFSSFEIENYNSLDDLLLNYKYSGRVPLEDSFSTLTNFFHERLALLCIVLLPILTNLFLKKKNHILFQSSLKADLNKTYRKSFIASFSSSWFLYIGLLGLMFLVSGLIFGFENGNYPYAITFAEDFTFMNTRKLIILNILLSSFALFFLQSLVTGLSLVFERKRAIRLYGVLVILGIVGSFTTKFSYLSPFSYLDSQGVITGLLRTFHGENKFTLLLGVVLLFLVSIVIHYFNIRQIKKNLLLKLKS